MVNKIEVNTIQVTRVNTKEGLQNRNETHPISYRLNFKEGLQNRSENHPSYQSQYQRGFTK